MQSVPGLNLPTTEELIRHDTVPDFQHEKRSDVPQRHWTEAGLCLRVRFEDGGARRSGNVFWNEPGHKLPVSRHRVRKTPPCFFTNNNFACIPGNLRLPSRSASLENPFPGGFTGPQGKQYGALANWGYANNERSWDDRGAGRRAFTSGIWESSGRCPARS